MELKMSDPMEQEHIESGANESDSSEEGQVMDDEVPSAGTADQSDTPDTAPPGPIFEVKFFEKTHFEQLGYRILQAVQKELNSGGGNDTKKYKVSIVTDKDDHATYLRATEVPAGETIETPDSPDAQPSELQSPDSPMNPDSPPDYSEDLQNLFMIDTQPATMKVMQVPSYKRAVKEIMDHNTPESKKMKEEDPFKCERTRPNNACFNCGESGHSLRQCPQPRNVSRINQAKRVMASKQNRYHVDVDQRFSHLKPGQTSTKLREAMELRDNEIPFYIYRMRTLGYPPGWLEDAKVEQSGMYLVGADSKIETEARENQAAKYDASKIHDFPGFNCPPEQKCFDDYKFHRVPRLNKKQFKDEFIKTLGLDNIIRGYRRKKMKDPAATNVEERISDTVEVADMDIEDDLEASPSKDSTMEDSGSRELGDLPSSAKDSRSGSQSPSLQDLEEKQRRLMEALQCNTSVEGTSKGRDDTDDEDEEGEVDDEEKLEIAETNVAEENEQEKGEEGVLDTDTEEQGKEEQTDVIKEEESKVREGKESDARQEEENDVTREEENDVRQEDERDEQAADKSSAALQADEPMQPSTPKTPVQTNKDNGIIKDTLMGTPLLKFSPFDKLPTGDNFRCGVSDVINFENLPDSTGKYAQMRGVIKKVRTIITKLNDEADGHD